MFHKTVKLQFVLVTANCFMILVLIFLSIHKSFFVNYNWMLFAQVSIGKPKLYNGNHFIFFDKRGFIVPEVHSIEHGNWR